MLTLGVVGSPRKDGLSIQLVDQALAGAAASGSQIRWLCLIDYDIPSFPHSAERRYDEIDELVAEADAMVIGSPAYYKDVSGLAREFIDYVHSGLVFLNLRRVSGKVMDVVGRESCFWPCIWEMSE